MPMKTKKEQRDYQRRWYQARRLKWLLENGPCKMCGATENLHVDHIDPSTKVTHLVWSLRKEKREAELLKCQVLCAPCHRKKSNEENRIRSSGKPNLYARRYSEALLLAIFKDIFINGKSQRVAAAQYGVTRSALSSILYQTTRPELKAKVMKLRGGRKDRRHLVKV